MTLALEATLAGLAGFRIALMLVAEDGPFAIFRRLRRRAGLLERGEAGQEHPKPFIGGLLSCVLCCSVWTTTGCYLYGSAVDWQPVAFVAAWGIAAGVARLGK